jgi:hypothetical protein
MTSANDIAPARVAGIPDRYRLPVLGRRYPARLRVRDRRGEHRSEAECKNG